MILKAIVAYGTNRVIGKDNDLIWHLPDDLKHFKKHTAGKTIIMGRKTWDSLGGRPPNRRPSSFHVCCFEAAGCESVQASSMTLVKMRRRRTCGGAQI